MLNGFKKFILRGNALDMAVGVVIGALCQRGRRAHLGLSESADQAWRRAGGEAIRALTFASPQGTEFPIGDFVNAADLLRPDRGRSCTSSWFSR